MRKAYHVTSRTVGMLGLAALLVLSVTAGARGPEHAAAKYSILRGDGSPRPAYTAIKEMPKFGLEPAARDPACLDAGSGL